MLFIYNMTITHSDSKTEINKLNLKKKKPVIVRIVSNFYYLIFDQCHLSRFDCLTLLTFILSEEIGRF